MGRADDLVALSLRLGEIHRELCDLRTGVSGPVRDDLGSAAAELAGAQRHLNTDIGRAMVEAEA